MKLPGSSVAAKSFTGKDSAADLIARIQQRHQHWLLDLFRVIHGVAQRQHRLTCTSHSVLFHQWSDRWFGGNLPNLSGWDSSDSCPSGDWCQVQDSLNIPGACFQHQLFCRYGGVHHFHCQAGHKQSRRFLDMGRHSLPDTVLTRKNWSGV